jgi:dTDP-4-amino-4,6-dideoxygalactose transaminase
MTDLNSHPVNTDWPITDDAIRAVFESMLLDGSWGRYHGPHCDRLREELGRMHGIEHVVLCSSGTSAVELALRSVPVTAGDEVILAAYDFKANLINVLTVGATPVLVDVLPGQPVIDLQQFEEAITGRTKAILISHLHGHLAPMHQICEMAESRGVAVIEDACQSPGAEVSGRKAGSVGDIGVLSFGGSKLLTSGRGGALLTSDPAMAQRIKLYTQRGNDSYPLSEMQAAVLMPQLKQLAERNAARLAAADRLAKGLAGQSTLKPTLTAEDFDAAMNRPAFYKFPILLADRFDAATRERLSVAARKHNIPLDPALPALHLTHSARRFRAVGGLRNAEALHSRLMTLHHTALLQSETEINQMAAAILHVAAVAQQTVM